MPMRNNIPVPEPHNPRSPQGVYLPFVPGITAQIISNHGEAFPNYDSRESEPRITDEEDSEYFRLHTVTKYIAVTSDSSFSIHLKVDRPYPKTMEYAHLQFEILVDGEFVWNSWCARADYKRNGKFMWEETIDGMKVGKGHKCEISKFRFSAIKTNDDRPNPTAFQRIKDSMNKIGKIEINVYKTKYGKPGGDVMNNKLAFRNKSNINVPEIALKGAEAKSHGTALGAGQKTSRGKVFSNAQKHDERPMIVFRFLYRSEEALKSMQIIEHTPTPSRSSSPEIEDHAGNNLTAAQANLAKQMADLETQKQQIAEQMASLQRLTTNSAGGGHTSARKRVKREYDDEPESSLAANKRRRTKMGRERVIVDLTGDSDDEEVKAAKMDSKDKERKAIKLDDDEEEDSVFVTDNRKGK
ncbi:hypothetical protein EAF00_002355 [Botryotinia globosa]|nr:hypothetical protein EAF00_002355 [Botryotinia globosa]